jgi:lysozyme family protein
MLTPTSDKFKKFANYIRSWEGGKSSDPNDSAAKYLQPGQIHTNRGVIWPTFKSNAKKLGIAPTYENFLKLTADQADQIVYQFYLLCGGNYFNDEIGLTLTEFTWGSGLGHTQRALRKVIRSFGYESIDPTGSINSAVISAANQINPKELYLKLWSNRKLFLESITKSKPANQKFLKGWLNRWESFQKTFPSTGIIAGGFFFYCINELFNL